MANLSDLSVPVIVDATKAHERIGFLLSLPQIFQRLIPLEIAKRWIMRGVKVTV